MFWWILIGVLVVYVIGVGSQKMSDQSHHVGAPPSDDRGDLTEEEIEYDYLQREEEEREEEEAWLEEQQEEDD